MPKKKSDADDLADRMRDEFRRGAKSIALLGPVKMDERLILARDGSDRVEAARGATATHVAMALSDSDGVSVKAFLNPTQMSLSPSDAERLRRIVQAMQ